MTPVLGLAAVVASAVSLEAPRLVRRFEVAEFVLHAPSGRFRNCFTDAQVTAAFTGLDKKSRFVQGFCDAEDGTRFRVRFAPPDSGVYRYEISGLGSTLTGSLRAEASNAAGPVVANPDAPKRFRHAGSQKPFYLLGYTAYHLLDPSRTEAQIEETIEYCARSGYNKIRFLLAGYPRDFDRRTSADVEHGVPDPNKAPNYGAPPGRVNPLPVWEGRPRAYDFTRFHLPYWRRAERAILAMRRRGIVANCILTIEKQDLPREYGRLTAEELLFYRYAVARLSAFDNVWWDLGNEHNEFRDKEWGDAMGSLVKALDPHGRLLSAHGYAEFWYARSCWPGYIITQQYGDEKAVHDWVLKYDAIPMPYVNEEYGYEGDSAKPGHGQNADWVRRNHWSIAMAGGYATYGDWSNGVPYYYTGDPGPGRAAVQLRHLKTLFEPLPFERMRPADALATNGFCLAGAGALVVYLPRGGATRVQAPGMPRAAKWFDPRTGRWQEAPGGTEFVSPTPDDWALLIQYSPK